MTSKNRSNLLLWLGCCFVTALIVVACVLWIDYQIAAQLLRPSKHGEAVGNLLSGGNLVTGEFLVITVLALVHIWRGGLPKSAGTLLAACCASVLAYTLNSNVLKVIFGRSNPATFYQTHAHKFALLRGGEHSSFPSGHMMLASAFLAVVLCAYPRTRIPALFLMVLGCVVLVLGDWHFVSDVIVGAFLGVTAGLVTAALWPGKSVGTG